MCRLMLLMALQDRKIIADYWKEHFYKILNANDYDHNLTVDVSRKLQNVQHDSNMAVSAKIITEIVSKLECGKSAGHKQLSNLLK